MFTLSIAAKRAMKRNAEVRIRRIAITSAVDPLSRFA
jgi:hypothetical protein